MPLIWDRFGICRCMHLNSAGRGTYLNCWCSLELRILEENLSASFSKLREYSSSISALRRKNSCRSCSSWIRDSDCCSKHLNCSTSWLRISVHQNNKQNNESTVSTAVTTCTGPGPTRHIDVNALSWSLLYYCLLNRTTGVSDNLNNLFYSAHSLWIATLWDNAHF